MGVSGGVVDIFSINYCII